MAKAPIRIALWSGPRNVSTTLMYSFAQRKDTKVIDEPLYSHYLSKTKAASYHPSAQEIIASMDDDGGRVVSDMLNDLSARIMFYKNMAHHFIDLDPTILKGFSNVFLIRDPKEVLLSFRKVIEKPEASDLAFEKQYRLYSTLLSYGSNPLVLDSKILLKNPRQILTKLCNSLNIDFQDSMLTWTPGKRHEDGIWAKHWYDSVHKSSGFIAYKSREGNLDNRETHVYQACLPFYNLLKKEALS